MIASSRRHPALSRKEWALVALGVLAWIAIAAAIVWFVHRMTRPPASCGVALEGRTMQARADPSGPRNALQLLAGTGRCP
jgi:hypothetical protein